MQLEALVGSVRAQGYRGTGYEPVCVLFQGPLTYEGNSNDIRVAGTGGEHGQMRK